MSSSDSIFEIIECSICYDVYYNKNISITPCGHIFCFNCILKAVSYNKECPICRNRLVEESDDEETESTIIDDDDEDDDDEDGEDEESDDDESNDYDSIEVDTWEIAERLEKIGYQMVDIVSVLENTRSRIYHTKEHFREIVKKYEEVYDEIHAEKRENYLFEKEDYNVLNIPSHTAAAAPANENVNCD